MILKRKLAVRLMACALWWYVPVFVVSVLDALEVALPSSITPAFRGSQYQWDFELMFTLLFLVWGAFLWRSSKSPQAHESFISFSVWAAISQVAAMLVIGALRPAELLHLTRDALVIGIPAMAVHFSRVGSDHNQSSC